MSSPEPAGERECRMRRRFRISPQAELIEDAFQDDRNLLHRCKWRFDRIQIEHQVIRIIQMLNARHPRILLNVAGVRDVEQLIAIGTDEIPDVAFDVLRPDSLACVSTPACGPAHPSDKTSRRESRLENARRPAAVEQVRNQVGRNLVVILDQVAFCVAVLGPEDLVEIGEFDLVAGTRAGSPRLTGGSPGTWSAVGSLLSRGGRPMAPACPTPCPARVPASYPATGTASGRCRRESPERSARAVS